MKCFEQKSPTIILNGDFNFPEIIWNSGEICLSTRKTGLTNILKKFTDNHSLNQKVSEPTRQLNILDLLYSNNHDLFQDISIEEYKKLSDHKIIMALTSMQSWIPKPKTIPTGTGFRSLNFFHETIDWEDLNNDISNTDWNNILQSEHKNEIYQKFCSVLLEKCKKYVPQRKTLTKRCTIPRDRRILMKIRRKLQIRLSCNNPRNRQRTKNELEQIEEQIVDSHRIEIAAKERRAIQAIKKNSKFFFHIRAGKGDHKNGNWAFCLRQ